MAVNWEVDGNNYELESGWTNGIRVSENGGMACDVYIPEGTNITSDTKIVVASWNPHDFYTNGNYFKQNTDDNSIYLIIPSIQDGSSANSSDTFADLIVNISEEYGISTENTVMISHSNGNKGTSAIATSLNNMGYKIGAFVNVEGNFDGENSQTFYKNFENGTSSDIPYIYVNDGSNHSYEGQNYYESFKNNCSNYIEIDISNTNFHNFYDANSKYNIMNYFINGDDLTNIEGLKIIYHHDGIEEQLSYEDFKKLSSTGTNGKVSLTNGALSKLDSSKLEEGTLASDLYEVYNAMGSINASISNNSAFETGQTLTLENGIDKTTSIPAGLLDAQKSVIGISQTLCGKLSKDTEVIMSVANTIYEMNIDLANEANLLSTGSNINVEGISETLDTALENASTLPDSFAQYIFNPSENQRGTTGVLNAADLRSMYSNGGLTGVLKDNIDSEISDANNTKTQINKFQDTLKNSTNFSGDIWKKVSSKLDQYSDLMDKRINSMKALEKAYEEALKLLTEYMEDYEELDDADLPELQSALEELKQNIAEAKNIMTATHEVTMYDTSGKGTRTWTVTVFTYSEAARAEAKAYIAWAEEQVTLVEAKIEKLEGLPDIISHAEQIVNDALISIYEDYGAEASSLVTGNTVSYTPPANTDYTPKRTSKQYDNSAYLQKKYATVNDYLNYNKTSSYDGQVQGTGTQKSREEFKTSSDLISKYGSYENYVAGVLKENDPTYSEEAKEYGKELDTDLSIPEEGILEQIEKNKETENVKADDKIEVEEKEDGNSNIAGSSDGTTGTPKSNNPGGTTGTPGSNDTGGTTNTPESNDTGGTTNTPESNNIGGTTNTPESNDTIGTTDTPGSNDTGGTTGTPESNDTIGTTDTPELNNSGGTTNTPESNDTGGTTDTPESNNSIDNTSANTDTQNLSGSDNAEEIKSTEKENNTVTENTIPVERTENNSSSSRPSTSIPSYINDTSVQTKTTSDETSTISDIIEINDDGLVEEIQPINETIVEPIEDVIQEPIITENEIEEIKPIEPTIENETSNTGSSNTLKTLGTIAAAGAAIGAAAFGAHTVMKSRENNEESTYSSDEESIEENTYSEDYDVGNDTYNEDYNVDNNTELQ